MAGALSDSEQAAAAADALTGGRFVVLPRDQGRDPVEVPASVVRVLAEALDHAQRGEQVRVIADDEEIATQQAADLLNVSRPYLCNLLDAGTIPHRKVGRHRRVKYGELMAYKRRTDDARSTALDELAAQAQELDMGY